MHSNRPRLQGSSFIAFPEFSLLPPNSALHPSPFSLCHTNITSFAEYCEELPAIARKISNCSAAARAPLDIMSCASARNPSATISYNTCEAVGNGHLYNTQVGGVCLSYTPLGVRNRVVSLQTRAPGRFARRGRPHFIPQAPSIFHGLLQHPTTAGASNSISSY
jgi:hypothetical protein